MPHYVGSSNTVRNVTDIFVGVNNVIRTVDKKYAGVSNVAKVVYDKRNYDTTFTVVASNYLTVGTVYQDVPSISGSTVTRNARYNTTFPLCAGDVITGTYSLTIDQALSQSGQVYTIDIGVINSGGGNSSIASVSANLYTTDISGTIGSVSVPSNHHNKLMTIRLLAEGDASSTRGTLSFTLFVNGKRIT